MKQESTLWRCENVPRHILFLSKYRKLRHDAGALYPVRDEQIVCALPENLARTDLYVILEKTGTYIIDMTSLRRRMGEWRKIHV